ncbi:McrC family protein [Pontixanthobacter gangjinensis]|uniref:Restriction endonuclease n=1 Tax=Christiangramia aestuarii TaxID=1028746 RepID=A0A7K1LML6_9FLAO|nr:restriction endonuclease [Christiangramia aestuarii]MUP42052.1 restriction endonuclease [Christiangramia aestuarii]
MSRLIRVFEHEKLTTFSTCSENKPLGKKVIDRLWEYNDKNRNIYFEAIRNGVKFKSYVGVIQIGSVIIEILPKADKSQGTDQDRGDWHRILLSMLKYCRGIKVDAVTEASLNKRYHSLLELYFELYVKEVQTLLKQGLIKKYSKKSGNVLALKGQIDFNKNIQQNLIQKQRFYTRHEIYDYEHLINQILLKGLYVLKLISNNSSLKDSIERTIAIFPDIKEIPIEKHHFERITLNRKTEKYVEAIKIAKMIILNYSPDIKGGNDNMLALLFDMNKLWEEYVYRMLRKVDETGLKVSFQNRDKFWEEKAIKPDLVVERVIGEKKEKFIIDTKWKIIENNEPSDDDLKQMYAYNMYWEAEKSMLLYPSSKPTTLDYGKFHKGRDKQNLCKLGFIKVQSPNGLNINLGKEILNLLN